MEAGASKRLAARHAQGNRSAVSILWQRLSDKRCLNEEDVLIIKKASFI
jgi:hypothetical protein